MTMPERTVYTIGHSTHSVEALAGLLLKHGITTVADVRSAPYSRFNPHFNKDVLPNALRDHQIGYVYLGRELGGRSDDGRCYEGGRIRYDRVARTPAFRRGIDRVRDGMQTHCLAVMCAEKEPLDCHRTLLVAPELERVGFRVVHIHADGHSETNAEAMSRLLEMHELNERQPDMLDPGRTREDLVDEAVARQARRVAYVDETADEGAP